MSDNYRFRTTSCLALALICAVSHSFSQEKKAKGRLPAYYAAVVNDQQRQAIYSIQAKYDQQLAALNEQLQAIEKRRDAEIESVLSPEQKLMLKKAQDEAAVKRKKSSGDSVAAEEPAKAIPAEMKKTTKKTK
jgi:hypothetical protein